VAPANREDPADPVAPANREDPADPAVLENRVGLADLAGPEDTSRAAQVDTADMGLVALVHRVALAGMNPVVQVDRVAPANQVGMRAVIRAGRNRALLGRNLVHPRRRLPDPDPTAAHPHRTRARPHPHLTRARPQEPTHPEAATHRPVPTHPAGERHLAAVIHPAEATHPAEEATPEPEADGVTSHYREFCSQSHGFENVAANCIGAQMNN
jgi:hypothetical protein